MKCAADLFSELLQRRKTTCHMEETNIHLAATDMKHNIRTPLTAMVIASAILLKDKNAILSSMTSAEEEHALGDRFQGAVETLTSSIDELKSYVESNLHIDLEDHPRSQAVHCNILETIRSSHTILLESFDTSMIEWSVDDSQLSLGTHISYPDVVKFVLEEGGKMH